MVVRLGASFLDWGPGVIYRCVMFAGLIPVLVECRSINRPWWRWFLAGVHSPVALKRAKYAIRFDEHRPDNHGDSSEPGREPRDEPRAPFGFEQPQSGSERAEQLPEPVPELSTELIVIVDRAIVKSINKRLSEL